MGGVLGQRADLRGRVSQTRGRTREDGLRTGTRVRERASPRRGLSPRVACKNTWARIEALQRNQAFIDRYSEARADHLAGREAIFPSGTWYLHRFADVKCAELGATAPPS